jgi:ribonuclease VapC
MIYVMDASAVLALMQGEIGSDVVDNLVLEHECVISAVNLAEVATKLMDKGLAPAQLARTLGELNVQPIDFDQEQSLLSAKLRISTKSAGLSLGDRACLALAQLTQGTAVTSDHAWQDVKDAVDVKILQIR